MIYKKNSFDSVIFFVCDNNKIKEKKSIYIFVIEKVRMPFRQEKSYVKFMEKMY